MAVQLHGRAVADVYVPVAPGARPEVQWSVPGGAAGHGYFIGMLLPDDATIGSVREIVERLGPSTAWARTWAELGNVCPVAPGVSARAQLTVFERRIAQWLRHLEAVCQHPRSQLTIEPERVHVARAKRLASSAAEFLAGHTEDWHHRTLRGVEPKRVLAVTMDDDLDIYENAVAARLVDLLLDHVTRRASELTRVRWLLEDAHDYSKQAGGTHWRQTRIYELWGEAFVGGDDLVREQARRTFEVLEDSRRRLVQLLDSPLYRAIPRQRVIPASLRMTNILANDQHYKWIARLWLARQEQGAGPHPDAEEPSRRYREAVEDWATFVALLVVRALDECGFEPVEGAERVWRGGPPLAISNGRRILAFEWELDGTIVLREESRSSSGERRLRVVPLSAALSRGADATAVEQVLTEIGVLGRKEASTDASAKRDLESEVQKRGVRRPAPRWQTTLDGDGTLVVYPGVPQERTQYEPRLQWALQTIQNDSATGPAGDTGVVPVSPLAIDSLERVGRSLRWWLASSWAVFYPATRRVDRDLVAAIRSDLPPGLSFAVDGSVVLHGRLEPDDRERVESALRRLSLTVAGGGRGNSSVAFAIDDLRTWLSDADRRLEELFTCLICGTGANQHAIEMRANGQVACTCDSCGAVWGIRSCGQCGDRFPYLRPQGEVGADTMDDIGWIDRTYGRDVLAIPRNDAGPEAYQCPACGA
jgi:hypothetical protein